MMVQSEVLKACRHCLPCPIDGAKAEWREHPYHGTGASGMEAPDLSIRCTACGLETTRERTEEWKRGVGTYSIREQAEARLLERWNTRTPAVATDEGVVERLLALHEKMSEAVKRCSPYPAVSIMMDQSDLDTVLSAAVELVIARRKTCS